MNNRRGIILMIASMFAFSSSDAFIKASSGTLTSAQIIFLLGIGGTVLFSALCLSKGQNPLPRTALEPAVILRNAGEVFGTLGIVTSIMLTTITTTSSIQQVLPVVVTMGAALFLGEKVGWRRWCAIFFGFLCVMLIIRPGLQGFDYFALWALLGVAGLAVRDLATKRISDRVTTLQLSVIGYLVLIPTGLVFMWWVGDFSMPNMTGYLYMSGILITSMLAYITITASVRTGELSAIVPFRYSRLIFALFYGIVFFGERPDWQTLVGAAGIIASGLFLMLRDKSS